MKNFRVLNCPICKSKTKYNPVVKPEIDPFYNKKIDKSLWVNYLKKRIFFTYHRCQCGLLTNKFYFNEKILNKFYSNMRDNVHSDDDISNDIKTKIGYLNQIKSVIEEKNELKILELGADNGSFLELIKNINPSVKLSAVEPNKRMHKKLKSMAKKIYSNINQIPKKEKFDLIIGIHVFDHIPNFLDFLKILKFKIKNNGLIYGVVHDEKSLMAKSLGYRWPAYCIRHPHLFNTVTIDNAFKKLNYDKQFTKKTKNFFYIGFLLQQLVNALFKKIIKFPNFFTIGLKLGNFSFLYKK